MLSLLSLLVVSSFAGPVPEDSPDHAYHYRTDGVSAHGVNALAPTAWARQGELKLKVKLNNTTGNYVLFRKDGIEVSSGGNTFLPPQKADKYTTVQPHAEGAQGFKIVDEGGTLHHKEMSVKLTGVFMVDAAVAPVQTTPSFLPARSKSFDAGPFACTLRGKPKQETDNTTAKYRCQFKGGAGEVGLVDPRKMQMALPDGKEFANEWGKETLVVFPGQHVDIAIKNTVIQPRPHGFDMQKTELTVKWEGVFQASKLEELSFPTWDFTLDEALTAAKND